MMNYELGMSFCCVMVGTTVQKCHSRVLVSGIFDQWYMEKAGDNVELEREKGWAGCLEIEEFRTRTAQKEGSVDLVMMMVSVWKSLILLWLGCSYGDDQMSFSDCP